MDKKVDIKKIGKQIFPNHTELGAYNQLAGKIGRRPLNQKEYDELKRTKRRPDSEINSENKTRNIAKNIIRLTESDLHRIVRESVQRILKEDNNRLIMHICAGLINGNIPSKVNMEEAWEGVFDMIVDMGNYGEISATCEGEMGDSQFHVVSADITWNGDSLEIDENDPECGTLNRCLELLAKGLSDI